MTITDGELLIASSDMDKWFKVSDESSKLALNALGLQSGSTAVSDTAGARRTIAGKVNPTPSFSFFITLDDSLKKEMEIDLRSIVSDLDPAKVDTSKLQQALQKEMDRKLGSGAVDVQLTDDRLEFKARTTGRKVMVGGTDEVLNALGMKNGQSNRIGLGGALQELFFRLSTAGRSVPF